MFRSTGSYEPDPVILLAAAFYAGFDPQALTSLTVGQPEAWIRWDGFDPQALTSLTLPDSSTLKLRQCFDPQALTSLTDGDSPKLGQFTVSIHRLLRA